MTTRQHTVLLDVLNN